VTVTIAGMAVRLVCDEPLMNERLQAWYADFIEPHDSPLATVEVEVKAGVQFLPIEPGPWVIRSSLQDGRLVFRSYFESGWVDFSRGRGDLVMASHGWVENFLRVLYAYLGMEQEAVLVHASGVVKGDKAYVFFGPSGSGKTTTARLSSAHTILSDDLVLLKKTNGAVKAYGVPFRGDLPETPRNNVNAELAGLFHLRKADAHFVGTLERPRALAELISCVPFVMATPATSQRMVGLCDELLARVPAKELHFRQDSGFWELIEQS